VSCYGVILVRQTYGETLKGKWTVPWGFAQGGDPSTYYDPPHVAALRETLEEAGVVAEVDGLLGIQNPGKSKEIVPPQPENPYAPQLAFL